MGCPKMALTISKIFGIEIDKDIVRRILKNIITPVHSITGAHRG